MASLLTLRFFQQLELDINPDPDTYSLNFTPDSETHEGEVLPEGAVFIGMMPEALINLHLWLKKAFTSNEEVGFAFIRNCHGLTNDEIRQGLQNLELEHTTLKDREVIFWDALMYEFDFPDQDQKVGFTSDFKVYFKPQQAQK